MSRELKFTDEHGNPMEFTIPSDIVTYDNEEQGISNSNVKEQIDELHTSIDTLDERIDGITPTVVEGEVTIFDNLYTSDQYPELEGAAISAKQARLLKDDLDAFKNNYETFKEDITPKATGTMEVKYWKSQKMFIQLCEDSTSVDYANSSSYVDFTVSAGYSSNTDPVLDPRGGAVTNRDAHSGNYKFAVIPVKAGDVLTINGITSRFKKDNAWYPVPIAVFVDFENWKIYDKLVGTVNGDKYIYNDTYEVHKDGLCFLQMYLKKTVGSGDTAYAVADGSVSITFAETELHSLISGCLSLEYIPGYDDLFNSTINVDTTGPCSDRLAGDVGNGLGRGINPTEKKNSIIRTAFLQRLLYFAGANSISKIVFPRNGHLYLEPDIIIPANLELDLNGCTLQCMTNAYDGYCFIKVPMGSDNVTIKNGSLLGDRSTHHKSRSNTSDEFNYVLESSGNNFVAKNLKIGCTRGDGINICGETKWNHLKGHLTKSTFRYVSNGKAIYQPNANDATSARIDLLGEAHSSVIRMDGSFDWDFTPKVLFNFRNSKNEFGTTYDVKYFANKTDETPLKIQTHSWGEQLVPPEGARYFELYINISSELLNRAINGTTVIEGNEANADTIEGENEDDPGSGNTQHAGENNETIVNGNVTSSGIDGTMGDGTFAYGSDSLFPGIWLTLTKLQERSSIIGCEIFDCGRNGMTPVGSKHLLIDRCYIHDIYGTNNMVGIDFEGTSFVDRDVIVTNTVVKRAGRPRVENGVDLASVTNGGSIALAVGDYYTFKNCEFDALWGYSAGITVENCRCRSISIYCSGTVNYYGHKTYVSNCVINGDIFVDGIVTNSLIKGTAQGTSIDYTKFETSRMNRPTYERCIILGGTNVADYNNCKIYKGEIAAPAPKDSKDNVLNFRDCYIRAYLMRGNGNLLYKASYNPSNKWYDCTYPTVNMYNCYVDVVTSFGYMKFGNIIGNKFFDKRNTSDTSVKEMFYGFGNTASKGSLKFAEGAVFKDNYIEVAKSASLGVCKIDISNLKSTVEFSNNIIDRKIKHTTSPEFQFIIQNTDNAAANTSVRVLFKNNTILKNYESTTDTQAVGDVVIALANSTDTSQETSACIYKEGNVYYDGLVGMPVYNNNYNKLKYHEYTTDPTTGATVHKIHGEPEDMQPATPTQSNVDPTIQASIDVINSSIATLQTATNKNTQEINRVGFSVTSLSNLFPSLTDNITQANNNIGQINGEVSDIHDSIGYLETAVFGGVKVVDGDTISYVPSVEYDLSNITTTGGLYDDPQEQTIGD